MNKTITILTGAGGLAVSELTDKVNIDQIASTVVQLLIGVVTLYKLLKKPKEDVSKSGETLSYSEDQKRQDRFP